MTYEELEQKLYARARAGMKLGLGRMERAIADLGLQSTQRIFHVAGTNGKGSTCAFLEACLRVGFRTGLYTSPHLEHFTERIRVNGRERDRADLVRDYLVLENKAPWAIEGPEPLTFFDFVTLFAFTAFHDARPDAAVIEVGLGGLHDATNVVSPFVTCITPIGFDHMEFLGNSLTSIATEKAGIIKQGVPCVSAAQEPEAVAVIEAACRERGAPLSLEGRDFRTIREGGKFSYFGPTWTIDGVELSLRGAHQVTNAAVATRALEIAAERGMKLTPEQVRTGLSTARWPGRLETVRRDPEIVLDGAHNPHGAAALARAIPAEFSGKTIHLAIGMLGDKEVEPVVAALAPLVASIVATAPRSPRALPAESLGEIARRHHASVTVVGDAIDAVNSAVARANRDDVVLVCGSLYLVGEVRAALRGERSGGPSEVLR